VIESKHKLFYELHQAGFSLVELVIIIVTLGILAVVAIPLFGDLVDSSRISATKSEMENLKRAIVGNPNVVSGGELVDRGFEGDIGFPPSQLSDLVNKPGSLSVYNKITRLGWNGPYIDGNNNDYLKDAWNSPYTYNAESRSIQSVGGSDTISITF
jgi:type II secretory pathway pseudopilin PulG